MIFGFWFAFCLAVCLFLVRGSLQDSLVGSRMVILVALPGVLLRAVYFVLAIDH